MGRIMMFCGYKETSIFMLLICLILQRYAFSIKFLLNHTAMYRCFLEKEIEHV